MKPYYEDDFVTLYHADCLEHPGLWTNATSETKTNENHVPANHPRPGG